MKQLFLTMLLGVLLIPTYAFHIVGGELEFIYVSDGTYRINLIQYFDEAQTSNPGPEAFINVYIFRNSDNALMSTHILPLSSQEIVEYTNPDCSIAELQTSRIVWTSEVNLEPFDYDDPEGYYLVWERCCRNADIVNIVNPDATGIKYILEIPPLMKNGEIFVNSSPTLFQPLSDYACINQLYYTEFTGIDPDGDSLVYSMTTPLNTVAASAIPVPQPKPNINVQFTPGFSENNQINGSPPLSISSKGLLTVAPEATGLYVFSVQVEEYRDGERIGLTRRDFQMLVIDGCEPPDPPEVDIDIPGDPGFDPMTDILSYTVADAKCFDFLVSNITPGETISLRAEGVNFDEELNEIFTINQIPVGPMDNQLRVEVCIPDCPPVDSGPFILDLIAGDNACPLPQLDTMRLTIEVEPPPNIFPTTVTTNKSINVNQASMYSESITATDADGDELTMSLYIDGIEDPTVHGFDLDVTSSTAGSITSTFSWDTDCQVFDFTEQQNFNVAVLIDDNDECLEPNPDTLYINSTVILPPNTDPVVSPSQAIPVQIDLGQTLDFDVSVTDADGDDVTLRFVGGNFNPDSYPMNFTEVAGNSSASSGFSWDLACDANLYADGEQFELLFVGDDDDFCKVKNFDTLRANVTVNYPDNFTPEFESIDRNQTIRINDNVRIEIAATDQDADNLILSFADGIRQPASASLAFEQATGTGRVSSFLEWQPECSLLRFGENSTLQDVVFQVVDDACPISNIDTLKITFEIVDDRERQSEFLPPNVFTPNGDGVNDTFQLDGNTDPIQNLPANNCDNSFEYIVINNRAGNTVFRSEARDFQWSGGQFPSGVYFFLIKYTNTEFKGYVHLIR